MLPIRVRHRRRVERGRASARWGWGWGRGRSDGGRGDGIGLDNRRLSGAGCGGGLRVSGGLRVRCRRRSGRDRSRFDGWRRRATCQRLLVTLQLGSRLTIAARAEHPQARDQRDGIGHATGDGAGPGRAIAQALRHGGSIRPIPPMDLQEAGAGGASSPTRRRHALQEAPASLPVAVHVDAADEMSVGWPALSRRPPRPHRRQHRLRSWSVRLPPW